MISIDDFSKVELKVGTVIEAEEVEGSEKLIKLTVDIGEDKPRTILTGMKTWKSADDFKGRQLVFLTNLEPKQMMGFESQGMVMVADTENGPVLLTLEQKVSNGSKIR